VVAKKSGADHVVRLNSVRGLARAFSAGIDTALELGADVIVNTDGDHQYREKIFRRLFAPILKVTPGSSSATGRCRARKEFSFLKKLFQRIGNAVVRQVTGLSVTTRQAFSGYSRDTRCGLTVKTRFSHTLER